MFHRCPIEGHRACNHLYLDGGGDERTDEALNQWISAPGLRIKDIESNVADELSMETSMGTLHDQIASIPDRLTAAPGWRVCWSGKKAV